MFFDNKEDNILVNTSLRLYYNVMLLYYSLVQ